MDEPFRFLFLVALYIDTMGFHSNVRKRSGNSMKLRNDKCANIKRASTRTTWIQFVQGILYKMYNICWNQMISILLVELVSPYLALLLKLEEKEKDVVIKREPHIKSLKYMVGTWYQVCISHLNTWWSINNRSTPCTLGQI